MELVKALKNLSKNYEEIRQADDTTSNPVAKKAFRKIEALIKEGVDKEFISDLKIQMRLGIGRLTSTPIVYLMKKDSDIKPMKGIYVAVILDNEEEYNLRVCLTQGRYDVNRQIKEENSGKSKVKVKKQVDIELAARAHPIAEMHTSYFKVRGFYTANIDHVKPTVIAEKRFIIKSINSDDVIYDTVNELLDVYLNNILKNDSEKFYDDSYVNRLVLSRNGQNEFRKKLFEKYGMECLVTGYKNVAALEASHIIPHSSSLDYSHENGLLLRADIHSLYDKNLIGIREDGVVFFTTEALCDEYKPLDGKKLSIKISKKMKENLASRFAEFNSKLV